MVPILEHLRAGHFYINDFWVQHNEHRLFFPQLLMAGLAFLTHWNTIVECVVGFLFAVGSFCLVVKALGYQILKKLPAASKWLLLILISFIWFSPVQTENWLWGWQIQWFMNVFGVALVIYTIAKARLSWSNLALLIAGGVLAQFSLGNGTLIWPIVVLALLYLRVPLVKVFSVFIAGVLGTILYYHRYSNISAASQHLAIHHPMSAAHYFFLYLGRPLSFFHHLATPIGILVFIAFIILVAFSWLRDRRSFRTLIPWVALGLYAIGTAAVTALARLSFGINEAASSRYTTISLLLIVSILVIAISENAQLKSLLKSSYRPIAGLTIGLGVILVALNWGWGLRDARQTHTFRSAIYSCTHKENPTNGCLLETYPKVNIVGARLTYLKQVHWGGY